MKNKLVRPFLQWAGGKRYLLPKIRDMLPRFTIYHEPFLGAGAILLSLQPKKAVVNDLNKELINVYAVIKEDVEKLIKELVKHENSSDYFYKLRSLDRDASKYAKLSKLKKASRTIFLNKTCFNGLFRVNKKGQFNTPFGRHKNPDFINLEVLRAVSKYLNNNEIHILNRDYTKSSKYIKKGHFVYFDPPYDPVSDTSSFTSYNLKGFGKDDQIKLKRYCDKLNKKGVKFIQSNSATPFIKELYQDYNIKIVNVPRSINCIASKRGKIEEVLIYNYDVRR